MTKHTERTDDGIIRIRRDPWWQPWRPWQWAYTQLVAGRPVGTEPVEGRAWTRGQALDHARIVRNISIWGRP